MIHLHGITKQYGSKVLFENAEAQLGYRSRVALIGPNGAGKSTLIRILLNQEEPDFGHVSRALHLSIGHLAQEVPKFAGRTVLEEVMRLDGRRENLLKTKVELEEKFSQMAEVSTKNQSSSGDGDPEDLVRYGRILEELDLLDEYRLESRAQEVLMGMGFKIPDFQRQLTEFSGGWLMRVALARILLMDPDLLLLDEPTNHLDLESLLWLEEFLISFRGSLLLVSHDTAFLNRVVNEVLEIDQKKLWNYRGNLDAYALQKQERLKILRAQYEGQQAKIAEIENFVARFGAKATKARQAQSRLKQLDRMDRIELPDDRASVRFRFPQAPHSGKEVVKVKQAEVSYSSKKVFRNLNWTLMRGSRYAVVGVNGVGKTTLLKLLSGQLEPTSGEVQLGHEVKVGYYAQLQAETLDMSQTVLQILEKSAPHLPVSQVRGIAGAFLFTGTAVEKKCGVLSGGEKARVALAKLLLSPSNFLILDEPTNHLDVESRGVLLDALQDYQGTLCLVSHDRSFVSPLVESVLEIIPAESEGQGSQVVHLLGSYEDYLEKKLKEASGRLSTHELSQDSRKDAKSKLSTEDSKDFSGQEANVPSSSKAPSHNQKRAWQRERDQLEIEISQLEKRQTELQQILGDPETYQNKLLSLQWIDEQKKAAIQLGAKMNRWEELCRFLE